MVLAGWNNFRSVISGFEVINETPQLAFEGHPSNIDVPQPVRETPQEIIEVPKPVIETPKPNIQAEKEEDGNAE